VVLRKGRVEQIGAPLDLYRRPANLFVAGFIGTPRINLFAVREARSDGGATLLRIGDAIVRVPTRFDSAVATIGFRPEHARLGDAGLGDVQFEVPGCETQAVEHLGDRTFCYLRSVLGDLVIPTPADDVLPAGTLRIAVDARALHAFDAAENALQRPAVSTTLPA